MFMYHKLFVDNSFLRHMCFFLLLASVLQFYCFVKQEKEEKSKFKLESKEKLKDDKKDKVKDKDKEKVKEKEKEKVKEKDKDKKDKKLTKVPSTFTCGIPFEEIFTLGGEQNVFITYLFTYY